MTTTTVEEIEKEFEELFANRGVIGDRKFKEFCTGIYEDILLWHINTTYGQSLYEEGKKDPRSKMVMNAKKQGAEEERARMVDIIKGIDTKKHATHDHVYVYDKTGKEIKNEVLQALTTQSEDNQKEV